MKRKLKEQNGFTLIIAIISLAFMSILGMTILSVTTSHSRMVKVDSRSQSSYYIAEAGANHIINELKEGVSEQIKNESREEFFKRIEKIFENNKSLKELEEKFEKNNSYQPTVNIDVEITEKDEDNKGYKIISTGEIGGSKRTVSSIISIGWNKAEKEQSSGISEILFKVGKFNFSGSEINAPGKTIVISGQDSNSINNGAKINVKNIYFDGNSVMSGQTYGDKNNPGDIYMHGETNILGSGRVMYGNVHTNGNFTATGGIKIYGDLIVKGNLQLSGGSEIHGNVYVSKSLKISGGTTIHGNVYVLDDIHTQGKSHINGTLTVNGNATLIGAEILKDCYVLGNIDATGGAVIGGNLNVDGNATFVGVSLNKSANIRGNLTLGWTPVFNDYVYYNGTLVKPPTLGSDKCKMKNIPQIYPKKSLAFGFTIPSCDIHWKQKQWYKNNDYIVMEKDVTGAIPKNAKWFVDRYEHDGKQTLNGEIIIVSKGDIILKGAKGVKEFNGALIAPNGKVEYSGGETFNGVIISKDEMKLTEGGTKFNLKSVEEYFGKENNPVEYSNCSSIGTSTGSEDSNSSTGVTSGKGKIIEITGIKEQ